MYAVTCYIFHCKNLNKLLAQTRLQQDFITWTLWVYQLAKYGIDCSWVLLHVMIASFNCSSNSNNLTSGSHEDSISSKPDYNFKMETLRCWIKHPFGLFCGGDVCFKVWTRFWSLLLLLSFESISCALFNVEIIL